VAWLKGGIVDMFAVSLQESRLCRELLQSYTTTCSSRAAVIITYILCISASISWDR